jgi:hypothetical protein
MLPSLEKPPMWFLNHIGIQIFIVSFALEIARLPWGMLR